MSRRNRRASTGQQRSRRERRRRRTPDLGEIGLSVRVERQFERCASSGKVRYAGERQALRALRGLQSARAQSIAVGNLNPSSPVEVRTYECGECGGHHTTSQELYDGGPDAGQTGEELEAVSRPTPSRLQQVQRGEDRERELSAA